MLPESVKSLAEIAEFGDPVVRTTFSAILFEHLLKAVTPNGKFKKLEDLLAENARILAKLPSFNPEDTRIIRNWVMHGDRRLSRAQVLHAESALQLAIKGIIPLCPQSLQAEAAGTPRSVSPQFSQTPFSCTQSTDQPSTKSEPVLPKAGEASGQKATPNDNAQAPSEPEANPPPSDESRSPGLHARPNDKPGSSPPRQPPRFSKPAVIYFGLAIVCVILSGLAYFSHRRNQQSQPGSTSQPSNRLQPSPYDGSSQPAAVVATPRPANNISAPPSAASTPPRTREDDFRAMINTGLSLSSSKPNLALLLDSPDERSVVDGLGGLLTDDARVNIVFNLADVPALKQHGFFNDLYAGNGGLLSAAARLAGMEYILLGKASYSFRSQADIQADLLACDLTLNCRLFDHNGTAMSSGSLSVIGPGFNRPQALQSATEKLALEIRQKIFNSIR